MFFSIRNKLTFIYVLLVLIPIAIVNYFSVNNMQQSIFHELEVSTLKTANVIGGLSRETFDDLATLKRTIRQHILQLEGRVVILDDEKNVLVDSFNLLEGTILDNQEVRRALSSQESTNYYQLNQRILQTAVPIIKTIEGEKKVLGAVLISVSAENFFQQVEEFRRQLFLLSTAAVIFGLFITLVASGHMAKPIVALSKTARRIAKGGLGETVAIKSRDEIGKLVNDFNYMSRELHRIDKGRMQFIGDVSHELKTPLAAMKALIDSLLYGEENVEVFKEYLRDMDTEIDRLTDIIKALLTLTKMEEMGVRLQRVDIKPIIDEAIKILKPLWQMADVNIVNQWPEEEHIVCDKDRFKELIINLIDNAIKYRDESKDIKKIMIRKREEKRKVLLIIEDNGVGIEKKDQASIFEKFYRTDMSRSRDTGGAGIGLSIVYRAVSLHQWEITVNSQLGIGTTFTIVIPKS